jgi:hypothetical protein
MGWLDDVLTTHNMWRLGRILEDHFPQSLPAHERLKPLVQWRCIKDGVERPILNNWYTYAHLSTSALSPCPEGLTRNKSLDATISCYSTHPMLDASPFYMASTKRGYNYPIPMNDDSNRESDTIDSSSGHLITCDTQRC